MHKEIAFGLSRCMDNVWRINYRVTGWEVQWKWGLEAVAVSWITRWWYFGLGEVVMEMIVQSRICDILTRLADVECKEGEIITS